jgi:hypothetical protein
MKKSGLIAFCIFALCSLLLTNAVTVNAAVASGYSRTETPTNTENPNTVDGLWNPAEEWYDANFTGTNATIIDFGSTYDSPDGFVSVYSRWVVEFFTDNTTDTDDYWEMCLDPNNAGGTGPNGTFRIRITGHDTLTVYQGNDTSWDEITTVVGEIVWNNSITTTPWSSDPHWVLEIDILKTGETGLAGITPGIRVAAYDASNETQGVVAWPPESDMDVPDEWGTNGYTMTEYWETIPEGFSIALVVLLSTAAMVVGFYFLRKKPKTDSVNLGKTVNKNYIC